VRVDVVPGKVTAHNHIRLKLSRKRSKGQCSLLIIFQRPGKIASLVKSRCRVEVNSSHIELLLSIVNHSGEAAHERLIPSQGVQFALEITGVSPIAPQTLK
jgi:hypothetical protein